MNPAPLFDRAYVALKARVMSGMWRPGERIDLVPLTDELGASITPVRDVLYRLVGERLISIGVNDGFTMAPLTEPDLRDLYEWNQQLLMLVLRARPGPLADNLTPSGREDADLADRTGALFAAIAARARNAEHRTAIQALNDRLHAVRLAEIRLLVSSEAEYAQLYQTALADDAASLRRQLAAYHRHRSHLAGRLVHALHRPDSMPM